MKPLFCFFTLATALAAVAAPDPAAEQRHHASVQTFDSKADRYSRVSYSEGLLDGNDATGVKFEAGRLQLILSLSKAENIESIGLVGVGRARFTVSVNSDNAAPGAGWQTVLKNAPLIAGWGTTRAINRSARYVLIETDATTPFAISEIALYGKLATVAVGHLYLSDVWASRASEGLAPIHSGPKAPSAFKLGGLGFPPRMPSVKSQGNTISAPPVGRIGVAPSRLRSR